jgi:hypothetical protein
MLGIVILIVFVLSVIMLGVAFFVMLCAITLGVAFFGFAACRNA